MPQDVIVPYIDKHQERIQVLKERLTRGKERTIHKRAFLRQAFRAALEKRLIDNKDHNALYNIEVDLLKAQILGILNAIKQNVNFHCAFVEQEFAIQFELAGDTAFFLFSSSELQGNLPAEHSQIGAAAWTHHPEVISRLHSEFDTKWKEIPPEWRTDSEEGRRNVIDFIVAESMKAMLEADVAPQELWVFMHELADMASYLDEEGFRKELYTREQLAQEVVIVTESFPSIIMPVEIGHWKPTDSIRTRQSLLDHILKRVKTFQVISTRAGIQEYWRSNHYGKYPFSEEWVQQHFQFVYNLLSEDKISMEIEPVTERSLVAIELIDHEFVRFEKTDRSDIEGGIALQDEELAQGLLGYITRHLSSMCPEDLKGAQNLAKWFEEQFGVTKLTDS